MKRLGTDVGRMARDLNALFKIAKTINSLRSLESFESHLLQLIGEVIPADSGAILIIPHIDDEPSSIIPWHRVADEPSSQMFAGKLCFVPYGSVRRFSQTSLPRPVVRSGCSVCR